MITGFISINDEGERVDRFCLTVDPDVHLEIVEARINSIPPSIQTIGWLVSMGMRIQLAGFEVEMPRQEPLQGWGVIGFDDSPKEPKVTMRFGAGVDADLLTELNRIDGVLATVCICTDLRSDGPANRRRCKLCEHPYEVAQL